MGLRVQGFGCRDDLGLRASGYSKMSHQSTIPPQEQRVGLRFEDYHLQKPTKPSTSSSVHQTRAGKFGKIQLVMNWDCPLQDQVVIWESPPLPSCDGTGPKALDFGKLHVPNCPCRAPPEDHQGRPSQNQLHQSHRLRSASKRCLPTTT